MWHKMTLFGKVLLVLTGLGFGTGIGLYIATDDSEPNTGNKTEVNIHGLKQKGEGDLVLDLNGTQTQGESGDVTEKKKEKKKFFGLFQ